MKDRGEFERKRKDLERGVNGNKQGKEEEDKIREKNTMFEK
jgi:hypothetical protein